MPTPLCALLATGALLIAGMASAESIGQFAAHQDIGAVKRAGAVSYDDKLQQ